MRFNNKNTLIVIISLIILVAAGGLLVYFSFQQKTLSQEPGDVVEVRLVGDFERKWAVNENGWDVRALTASGDTAYYSGKGVNAVNAVTGSKMWESPYKCDQLSANSGSLYCAGWKMALTALDAATGKVRWQLNTGDGTARPFISGNTVYAGNSAGEVIAADSTTGTELWRVSLAGAHQTAIDAIDGNLDTIAVIATTSMTDHSSLVVLDAASGARKWERDVPLETGLATAGGLVFFTSTPAGATGATLTRLQALDAATGAIRWEKGIPGTVTPVLKVIDGTLYSGRFEQSTAILSGLDPATGSEKWSSSFDAGNPSSPYAAPVAFDISGGLVYFSLASEIGAADAQSGDLKWLVKAGGLLAVPPVIADDSVCFAYGSAGTLYAVSKPSY